MQTIRPTIDGKFERVAVLASYFNLALGNGTMFQVGLMRYINDSNRMFIGIEGKGCYTFEQFAHAGYVQEKLKLLEGDAANVADFINCQLGIAVESQGSYQKDCCLPSAPVIDEPANVIDLYNQPELGAWDFCCMNWKEEIIEGLTGYNVDGDDRPRQDIVSMLNRAENLGKWDINTWKKFFEDVREKGI